MRAYRKVKTFDLGRAAFHFPVGVFVGWLSYVNVPIAYLLGAGFLVYELAEDMRIRDRAFLDIIGYLFGLGAAVVVKTLFLD